MRPASDHPKQKLLNTVLRYKVLLEPGIAAPEASAEAQTPWHLRRLVERNIAQLPAPALSLLVCCPRGYVAVTGGAPRYEPGVERLGTRQVQAVASLPWRALAARDPRGLVPLAQLIDHLLGSFCAMPEGFLSAGHALSPSWLEVTEALRVGLSLGYHELPASERTPSHYFWWACSLFFTNRRRLGTVDPIAYRLLRSTLFAEAFWRGHPVEPIAV
jgi:hypothetical protein